LSQRSETSHSSSTTLPSILEPDSSGVNNDHLNNQQSQVTKQPRYCCPSFLAEWSRHGSSPDESADLPDYPCPQHGPLPHTGPPPSSNASKKIGVSNKSAKKCPLKKEKELPVPKNEKEFPVPQDEKELAVPKGVTIRPSGRWVGPFPNFSNGNVMLFSSYHILDFAYFCIVMIGQEQQAQMYFAGQSRYVGVYSSSRLAAHAYRAVHFLINQLRGNGFSASQFSRDKLAEMFNDARQIADKSVQELERLVTEGQYVPVQTELRLLANLDTRVTM
jgi:hypothetical protein